MKEVLGVSMTFGPSMKVIADRQEPVHVKPGS